MKNMFRDETKKTALHPEHFGAGSIIDTCMGKKYLVFEICHNRVRVLNLTTFEVEPEVVFDVEDANHMTENEVREIVRALKDGYTFSDYRFDARGLK